MWCMDVGRCPPSGYTTAVLAALVGDSGRVTSMDVNPDLTARARARIDATTTVLVCGDGTYGHAAGAPFDRVIARATPPVIPKAWVDQTRDGGRIVTPVKVAPVASANLTVAATLRGGGPTDLTLHAGSFVDMTPTDAPQHYPAHFLDALIDHGDLPAWLSAVPLRDRPGAGSHPSRPARRRPAYGGRRHRRGPRHPRRAARPVAKPPATTRGGGGAMRTGRGQKVAIGLTGLPDVPAKRIGATASWNSHWPSSAAVRAHASRSQLSSSHRPIATRPTAWTGINTSW